MKIGEIFIKLWNFFTFMGACCMFIYGIAFLVDGIQNESIQHFLGGIVGIGFPLDKRSLYL